MTSCASVCVGMIWSFLLHDDAEAGLLAAAAFAFLAAAQDEGLRVDDGLEGSGGRAVHFVRRY